MSDPEADLDNAALAEQLRALLGEPSPQDRAAVDPAQRTAEIRAAIQRAWPHDAPPAAEPGHHEPAHHEPEPGHLPVPFEGSVQRAQDGQGGVDDFGTDAIAGDERGWNGWSHARCPSSTTAGAD